MLKTACLPDFSRERACNGCLTKTDISVKQGDYFCKGFVILLNICVLFYFPLINKRIKYLDLNKFICERQFSLLVDVNFLVTPDYSFIQTGLWDSVKGDHERPIEMTFCYRSSIVIKTSTHAEQKLENKS